MKFVEYETLTQEWFETDETKSGWDSLGWGGESPDQELERVTESNKYGLPTEAVFKREVEPEYEMYLQEDDNNPFAITGWIPIHTDRIKNMDRLDEYIEKGLIRKYVAPIVEIKGSITEDTY